MADENSQLAALAGRFDFRFSGYAMAQDRPFHLTGLGQFEIKADGALTGEQRSAIMAIQGQGAAVSTGAYDLTGTIRVGDGNNLEASIFYKNTKIPGWDLTGQFFVVSAENTDRLWFISAGAKKPDGSSAEELVSLEALRRKP